MPRLRIALVFALVACQHPQRATTPGTIPTPETQVGSCANPGRDGVIGSAPRLEHADRDLNGDGAAEAIIADRSLCTAEGNCYWNVFIAPTAGSSDCVRYAGTLQGRALEPLTTKGDDSMADVRSYWTANGGRVMLHSYHFVRGGYNLGETLVCKRGGDDKLDCADLEH
jgi:hypothetical protein